MFSVLAVGYLFLGGAGAGAIAVASILDLAWVRAPFGHASRIGIGEATPLERTVAVGMLAGFAALALGMLFLLFDLGRIDRVASLLLRPSLSFLTVGTYALAGLAVCAALLVAVRFAYLPSVPRGAVRAVEAAAAVVAVVVMLYTGLLLQNTGAVALWSSPLVPVLFLLSSLSCGIATLLLAAYFAPADAATAWLFRMLARVDALIVVLEAVAARHPETRFEKLNAAEHPDIAWAFKVVSVPTLVLFRDGVPVDDIVGAVPAQRIEDLLAKGGREGGGA